MTENISILAQKVDDPLRSCGRVIFKAQLFATAWNS